MSESRMRRALALGSLLAVLPTALGGCVDEEKVYGDDRPVVSDPAPAANGFLGYTQATAKLTICGNCHAQPQAEWVGTAHADAWETLQASGHAQPFCEGCHTVSELGNDVTSESGWTATGDPRYHDVQCESCHGAGLQHVTNPTVTQPIPALAVTDGTGAFVNCAECHNGTHHPFVEQWVLSRHANAGSAASREGCADCHSAQGALIAWGVRADYREKDGDALPLVCGVCHDPHDNTYAGQLRFPVENASIEVHLCARCHNRRSVPDPQSSHGLEPHSPEALLLVGEAGWFPPGANFAPGTLVGTHGTAANDRLCAACHVHPYEVTDPSSGDFLFQAVGHTFQAIPCVDAAGIPDGTTGCALTAQARNWEGCTTSGCHGTVESVNLLLQVRLNQITSRASTLIALLELVDPNLEAAGGEIDPVNTTFTVAEGAYFNWSLANHGGSPTGSTVHNFDLTHALLGASIVAVEREYGVSLP
jgi:hypothetical protein